VGEGLVGRLDVAQIILSLMLSLAKAGGAVLADNSGDGVDTPGEIELVFEVLGAEGMQAVSEADDLLLGSRGKLVGTVMRRERSVAQPFASFYLVAVPPFADGRAAGGVGAAADETPWARAWETRRRR